MSDLGRQLRDYARHLDEQSTPTSAEEARSRPVDAIEPAGPQTSRSPRVLALVALLVVVGLAGAAAVLVLADRSGDGDVVAIEGGASAVQWDRLEPGPFDGGGATFDVAVWTGDLLVLPWQEGRVPGTLVPGARWDRGTGEWSEILQPPIEPRTNPVAIWTGQEVIIWGGTAVPQIGEEVTGIPPAFDDGAAYDPDTDRWRRLADSPLPGGRYAAGWTADRLVLWGAPLTPLLADEGLEGPEALDGARGAAYDPATDTWTEIAPAPPEMTAEPTPAGFVTSVNGDAFPDGLVVWVDLEHPASFGDPGPDPSSVLTASYDPSTDAWSTVRESPLPGVGDGAGTWTEAGLVTQAGDAIVLFPSSGGEAERIDQPPIPPCVIADDLVAWLSGALALTCGDAAAVLDAETLTWTEIEAAPLEGTYGDPRVGVWGAPDGASVVTWSAMGDAQGLWLGTPGG